MTKQYPNLSSRHGFSIIELLSVIAVIAILTAIIIPAVDSVRSAAKTTKSLSNLRQIATAMQMYSSDNDGLYPVGYDNSPETYWYTEIAKYLDFETISNNEGSNLLISPFAVEEFNEGNLNTATGGVLNAPTTYSVHGVICPSVINGDSRFPIWNIEQNISDIILVGECTISSAAGSLAVFESPEEWNTYASSGNDPESAIPTDDSLRGQLSYRANNHALVAFLDGHVEAIPKGEVKYRNITISP